MIQIAKFTEQFFVELMKDLLVYNTLYVTEDGNVYVNEAAAVNRCQSREKLAHLNSEDIKELRYAKVHVAHPPKKAADLEAMFEAQYTECRNAARQAVVATAEEKTRKRMSDEEARAILYGGKEAAPAPAEESKPVETDVESPAPAEESKKGKGKKGK